MVKAVLLPLLVSFFLVVLFKFISVNEDENAVFTNSKDGDCGEPLFLTPYIESGLIEEARNLSRVGTLPNAPNVPPNPSYSGYFTVNKKFNSNMFFWFFTAQNGDKSAPLIMWIEGGPGSSGFVGLFLHHGPYVIDADMNVKLRKYHWAQNFNLLYVDNPVGTGFSFTEDGYATNQTAVASDLYEMLQQFFTVFADYRSNEFYITGESYGGKYVPAIAYKIHTEGPSSKINLKGIAIGNGLSDPETMLNYHDYFYQLGLINRKQRSMMQNLSNTILQHIQRKEFYNATVGFAELIANIQFLPFKRYFQTFSGYNSCFNHLNTEDPKDLSYFPKYIEHPMFRKAVHVGNLTFNDGQEVMKQMLSDFMKSVKPWVAVLMDNYRVLYYNGQLDIIVPYPSVVNFLHSVDWKYSKEYENAERQIWRLNGTDEIAGYVTNVEDFYEVLVRKAGHLVPHDQPQFTLDLITRFVLRQPYS